MTFYRLCLCIVAFPLPALANNICESIYLQARIANSLTTLTGTITCDIASTGPLWVATYPRILRASSGLDDISSFWYYPRDFSTSNMSLWRHHHGHPATALVGDGPWQNLGQTLAGQRISLSFATSIPERNGTFGRSHDTVYLLGGWHPAFGRGQSMDTSNITYDIIVPSHTVGFVGHTPFGHKSDRRVRGRFRGHFVPVLVAAQADVTVAKDGILVVPKPPVRGDIVHMPGLNLREIGQSSDTEAHAEILETLRQGGDFAASKGVKQRPILAVVTPLRAHLSETFDTGIAISDRAFHLLSWELMQRFHRAALWREQLAILLMPHANLVEKSLPPEFAADAVACTLRAMLLRTRYGIMESADNLLDRIAIIPEIDALVFAPQIPFIDAYYSAIDEAPRGRWKLDDFYHALPRGKLFAEKMSDSLGVAALESVAEGYSKSQDSLFAATQKNTGYDVKRLMEPWLGTYPRLNYHLSVDKQTPSVAVVAQGPDSNHVTEPLTVEAVDANAGILRAQRNGPGEFDLSAATPPLSVVQLDPDGRLVELWHAPGYGPRFDNRDPQRYRFLLNNIAGLFSITGAQLTAAVDFTLRRIHDLTYDFVFYGSYSESALGVSTTFDYNFGAEITPLRLSQGLSLTGSYSYLRPEYGAANAGNEASLSLDYGYDSRLNYYYSYEGSGIDASLLVGAADTGGKRPLFLQAGASALHLFPFGLQHALVARLRGDITVGNAPEQNLFRLGGRYTGARGYEADETRGTSRIIASAEYRHVLEGESRNDLAGLLFLTRVDGALFADAVYLKSDRSDCPQIFYDIGYGVRFFFDILNISPSSLQIDAGVPINRCGLEAANRLPFTVYLAVLQSFSSF